MAPKKKSKRERRLERAAEEKEQLKKANDALRERLGLTKTPSGVESNPGREATSRPFSYRETCIVLSHQHEDRDGHWSWGTQRDWGDEYWETDLGPFFGERCMKTWNALDREVASNRKRNRPHRIEDLVKEAQDRLFDISKDDFGDNLYKFRRDGEERILGFRINQYFYILWWDPDHKIVPSEKRNT